jgi:hypothetical protein
LLKKALISFTKLHNVENFFSVDDIF